jgi:hypothetical protein
MLDNKTTPLPGSDYDLDKRESGLRYNTGKLRWNLVDFKALETMVRVLEYGANKYTVKDSKGVITHEGTDNWKKGLKVTEICDSMMRHLFAFLAGEDTDPESKQLHVGHILCNALFLSYTVQFNKAYDDRRRDNNHNPL